MLKTSEVNYRNPIPNWKGFPRPVVFLDSANAVMTPRVKERYIDKAYPVPYTANNISLADIDEGRVKECAEDQLCIMCGLEVDKIFAIWFKQRKNFASEPGPFHKKCAKITIAQCPFFSVKYHASDFEIVEAKIDDDGNFRLANGGSHLF